MQPDALTIIREAIAEGRELRFSFGASVIFGRPVALDERFVTVDVRGGAKRSRWHVRDVVRVTSLNPTHRKDTTP